jgi:hypothetical protein
MSVAEAQEFELIAHRRCVYREGADELVARSVHAGVEPSGAINRPRAIGDAPPVVETSDHPGAKTRVDPAGSCRRVRERVMRPAPVVGEGRPDCQCRETLAVGDLADPDFFVPAWIAMARTSARER